MFLVAFVACGVVIGLVEGLGMFLYPPPAGVDPQDPAQLAALVARMPLGALLMVELSYLAGSLALGLVVARLARSRQVGLTIGGGVLFTLAGIANLVAIPHPAWFAVLSTVTYVPAALLGLRLGRPRT